jgi:hypothetical protein
MDLKEFEHCPLLYAFLKRMFKSGFAKIYKFIFWGYCHGDKYKG